MPFINGRFYMNPLFGAALERARLRVPETEDTDIIEGLPSLNIDSGPRASGDDDADTPSGFCDLTASVSPHGVHCERDKDYHGTAYMELGGPGIQFHKVDENSIRATAAALGDIVSVDGDATPGYDGKRQWKVPFAIRAGKNFQQQGGAIQWTVTYKCNGDELEWQAPLHVLYCL